MSLLAYLIGALSLGLLGHSLFSLWLMLHAWDSPEQLARTSGPERMRDPELSFSVLLPARDEQAVIAETITRLRDANYPRELLEIVVICQRDDVATIAAAEQRMAELNDPGIALAIYDEPPFNKPHALMTGLAASRGQVIAVFDAEDDVHPDLFSVINSTMLERDAEVVQGGVQLTNFRDHWFSPFNCLEYFFYYRSRMHFNARVGMVPLGGNTVFFDRQLLERVGGWDLSCLTEDADIGMRISALGVPISVIYDSRFVTREETPHTVTQFVKQRTRWHQGFLQILARGQWRRIPGWRRRLLALMTLSQPILDGLLLVYGALIPVSALLLKLPALISILTFLPLYGVGFQMLANLVGIRLFARCYEEPLPLRVQLAMPFTFLPFQWMIAVSALRAGVRHVLGRGEWEKTEHRGAHRVPLPAGPALRTAPVSAVANASTRPAPASAPVTPRPAVRGPGRLTAGPRRAEELV